MSETVAAPQTDADKRKAVGERLAAARAAARAARANGTYVAPSPRQAKRGASKPRSRTAKPAQDTTAQPAFLNDDAPQPEARFDTSAKAPLSAEVRQAAVEKLAVAYAGSHFVAAWATSIPELQIAQQQALAVSQSFIEAMESWDMPVDAVFAGKIGASINFAVIFAMVELEKVSIFNQVMAQRMANARAQAHQAANGPQAPQDFSPAPVAPGAPGLQDTIVDTGASVPTMGDPFARREAAE